MKPKRTGMITKLIIAVLVIYAVASLVHLRDQIAQAQADLAVLETRRADLIAENDELQYALDHMDDPSVLEKIAREEGYVFQNEEVYTIG